MLKTVMDLNRSFLFYSFHFLCEHETFIYKTLSSCLQVNVVFERYMYFGKHYNIQTSCQTIAHQYKYHRTSSWPLHFSVLIAPRSLTCILFYFIDLCFLAYIHIGLELWGYFFNLFRKSWFRLLAIKNLLLQFCSLHNEVIHIVLTL